MVGRLAFIVLVLVVAMVVVGVWLMCGYQGVSGGKLVVRVGTLLGGISTLDVMEVAELGREYGFALKVYRFHKTPEILTALARGDIDVAVVPAEMAAKLLERGVKLKIIAVDMCQNQAVLSMDPAIESIEDLVGRRVGAVVASGTYRMFKAYVKLAYGIEVSESSSSQDAIHVVNLEPGAMISALERGDVDAIVVWEPIVSKALVKGAHVVEDFASLWRKAGGRGLPVMLVYVARESWVDSNPDLARKFVEARLEAAKMWVEDKSMVVSMLKELYHLSEEEADILYSRVEIVDEQLNPAITSSIKSVWKLAWVGGYLSKDPASIPDTVFYLGG